MAAEIVGRVVSFVAGVLIARVLGVADYGVFSFAFSYAALFAMVCDFGLAAIAVRDIAADPARARWYTGTIVMVRLVLAVVAGTLLAATLFLWPHTPAVRETTLLFGASLAINALAEVFTAAFRASERMGYVSAVMLAQRAASPVLGLLLLACGHGLRGVVLGYVVGSLGALLLGVYLFVTRIGRPAIRLDPGAWRPMLAAALPLAVSLVFSTVYFRMDAVLLAALRGTDAVGVFHAAWRIMEALMFVPMSFVGALFPLLAGRCAVGDRDRAREVIRRGTVLLAALALPLAVWVTRYAPLVAGLLYGGAFTRSALPLAILMWAEVAIFVNYLLTQALVAAHLQKYNAQYTAICAGVNILLNLVFIPRFAEAGAALATLTTEVALLVLCVWRIDRALGATGILEALARPAAAAAGMGTVLWMCRGFHPAHATAAGVVAYLALTVAFGVFRAQDAQTVRDALAVFRRP